VSFALGVSVGIIASVIAALLIAEFSGFVQRWGERRIVNRAALLPPEHQDRFEREWIAEFAYERERRGDLLLIWWLVGLNTAALGVLEDLEHERDAKIVQGIEDGLAKPRRDVVLTAGEPATLSVTGLAGTLHVGQEQSIRPVAIESTEQFGRPEVRTKPSSYSNPFSSNPHLD